MSNQEYSDDEIDLRDYIEVMIKRKKTILTIFFICVTTATVISFLMPKVYETSTVIKIGSMKIGDSIQPLLVKEEVISKLREGSLLNSVIQELNLNINVFALKTMVKTEDIKNTNLVRLKIQNKNPDLAVKICNTITETFIMGSKSIYDKNLTLLNEEIKVLEKRREITGKEMEKLSQIILLQTTNPEFALIIQNTLSNYNDLYSKTDERIYLLKEAILNSQQFEIFESALKQKFPIKPNKRHNITISAVLGLMLGVFVAFFRNSGKKEETAK